MYVMVEEVTVDDIEYRIYRKDTEHYRIYSKTEKGLFDNLVSPIDLPFCAIIGFFHMKIVGQ